MTRLVAMAVVMASCGEASTLPTIGRWNMAGCPHVDSGVYLRELEVCQVTDVREVFMGGDGSWDPAVPGQDLRRAHHGARRGAAAVRRRCAERPDVRGLCDPRSRRVGTPGPRLSDWQKRVRSGLFGDCADRNAFPPRPRSLRVLRTVRGARLALHLHGVSFGDSVSCLFSLSLKRALSGCRTFPGRSPLPRSLDSPRSAISPYRPVRGRPRIHVRTQSVADIS
jgi:hypothetical protein